MVNTMSGRNDIDIVNLPLPYADPTLNWLGCVAKLSVDAAEFTVFTSVY